MENQTSYDVKLPDGTEIQTNQEPTMIAEPQVKAIPVETKTAQVTTPSTVNEPQTNDVIPTIVEFDELIKDPKIKSEFDKRVSKVVETAIKKDREKQEGIRSREKTLEQRMALCQDEKSRNELLLQIIKEQNEAADRKDEQLRLRSQVASELAEKKLPETMIDLFDFKDDSQETIDKRLNVIAEFHASMQASFDKKLADEQSKWRVQLPPEQYGINGKGKSEFEKRREKYQKK